MSRPYTVQRYRLNYVRETARYDLDRRKITHKKDVDGLVRLYLRDRPVENVIIIALDNNMRIIGIIDHEGTVNQCSLYPRNVFTFLLGCGAASFVVAHNHPGGTQQPSASDWSITNKLFEAGKALEIPMADHMILADKTYISLREYPQWPK